MKRSTLFFIALSVLAAHGALFWIVRNQKVLPPREYVPSPNFSAAAAEFTDPQTGKRAIYREFTVSTKLADKISKSSE